MEPTHAIVEIMGHRSHAGLVSEIEMFGGKMMQIITPELPELPEESRLGRKTVRGYYDEKGAYRNDYATGRYVSSLVPAVPPQKLLYGASAVFSVTPCTEAEALEYAGRDRKYRNEEWVPDAREPLALSPVPATDDADDTEDEEPFSDVRGDCGDIFV